MATELFLIPKKIFLKSKKIYLVQIIRVPKSDVSKKPNQSKLKKVKYTYKRKNKE